MSSLLMNEYPLVILPKLAKAIGLIPAIVLQQIHYWLEIKKKERSKLGFYDNKHWVYNTIEEWNEQFPFISESTIKRAFKVLKDKNLIETMQLNKHKWDNTNFYTIEYTQLEKIEQELIEDNKTIEVGHVQVNLTRTAVSKRTERDSQNDPFLYTETSTETTTDINNATPNGVASGSPSKSNFLEADTNIPKEKATHPLLDYWNSLSNTPKHKSDSKTYKRAVALLVQMRNGTFGGYVKHKDPQNDGIDLNWLKSKHKDALFYLKHKFTDEELKRMMDNLNDYLNLEFFPNKGTVSYSLEKLLFNQSSKKSFAIWLFLCPSVQGNRMVQSKYPDVEEIYKNTLQDYTFDDRTLTLAVNSFCDKVEELFKIAKENCYDIKIPDDVYKVHAQWIAREVDLSKYALSSVLSVSNGFFSRFEQYIQKTYGCCLKLTEEDLKANERKVKFKKRRMTQ